MMGSYRNFLLWVDRAVLRLASPDKPVVRRAARVGLKS